MSDPLVCYNASMKPLNIIAILGLFLFACLIINPIFLLSSKSELVWALFFPMSTALSLHFHFIRLHLSTFFVYWLHVHSRSSAYPWAIRQVQPSADTYLYESFYSSQKCLCMDTPHWDILLSAHLLTSTQSDPSALLLLLTSTEGIYYLLANIQCKKCDRMDEVWVDFS